MTTTHTFDAAAAGRRFAATHKGATAVPHALATPPGREAAFRVQDATLAALGAVGGWKVGAKGPDQEPGCAPLPASGFFASGISLVGPPWHMRGIEVEVALRLARDLVPVDGPPDAATVRAAIGEVLPAIEIVETRLADWRESSPLAQLADLQSHGAMVLGKPSTLPVEDADLRTVEAYLAFDGQPVAVTRGANPAADIWRLVSWLAWHCVERGQPLRAGQVVTTGSCTGLLFAPEGAHVQAQLAGIGMVELRF